MNHAQMRVLVWRSRSEMKIVRSLILISIAALGILLAAESTLAQCAMCRASIGGNSSFIRTFNIGVLVLLIPPVTIFVTIFVLLRKYRATD